MVVICEARAEAALVFASPKAPTTPGITKAASTPRITTTIRISIRVNPRRIIRFVLFLIVFVFSVIIVSVLSKRCFDPNFSDA